MIIADIKDLWRQGEIVCVTTNGFIKRNNEGVMGRGNALAMAQLIPGLAKHLGEHIKTKGNIVGFIYERIIAFPVKPSSCRIDQALPFVTTRSTSSIIPGFHCKASIPLICSSANSLIHIARAIPEKMIYLPVPGIVNGGLSKTDHNYKLYVEIIHIIEKEPNITLTTLKEINL